MSKEARKEAARRRGSEAARRAYVPSQPLVSRDCSCSQPPPPPRHRLE